MKWSSHRIITGLAVYAVTMAPLQAAVTALASVIPDAIEGSWNGVHFDEWQNKHRQKSHWFLPYLIIFMVLQAYNFFYPTPENLDMLLNVMVDGGLRDNLPIIAKFVSWLMLGACFHIAEDAMCGVVPGLTMDQRVGIKLFNVGSVKEHLSVFGISAILCASIVLSHF